MNKKWLSSFMVVVMAASMLAGCSANTASTTTEPTTAAAAETTAAGETTAAIAETTAAKSYNIGFSNMQVKEDFFITVEGGIRKAAEAAGYQYNTTIADRDATKMKQNIEALVTKGADIIIDFNVLPEAGAAITADLQKEGIPLLSVDSIYPGAYFFGVNNLEAGKALGEATIPFVDSKFGGTLEFIVNIYDASNSDEIKKRNDGVVEVLQAKYNVADENVFWLDCKADDVKTLAITKDWLNSHPDASKVVFVGYNDDRGYSINSAVKGEERTDDSLIVSHNADPSSLENLMEHVTDKDTAWVATTAYNSHLYGQQIIDMATRILNGEEVEQAEYTKITIVTTDNVETYISDRDATLAAMG